MSMYAIKDTTLTAFGDAVRQQTGQKYTVTDEITAPIITTHVDDTTVEPVMVANSLSHIVYLGDLDKLLGDKKDLTKSFYYSVKGKTDRNSAITAYLYICKDYPLVKDGVVSNYSYSKSLGNLQTSNSTLEGFFNFKSEGYADYKHFYIVFQVYDWIANPETITFEADVELSACDADNKFITLWKYTPTEMVETLNGVLTLPTDALTITGSCEYRFAQGGWDWFINRYGDKIITKDITNISRMFFQSKAHEIPFEINLSSKESNSFSYAFNYSEMEKAPVIKGNMPVQTGNYSNPLAMNYLFSGCRYLHDIPDDWFDTFGGEEFWAARKQYSNQTGNIFQGCGSLRKLPNLDNLCGLFTTASHHLYYSAFNECYILDEIRNLPTDTNSTLTSNACVSMVNANHRLQALTFQTNEDGTPKIVKWKSQIIDLSSNGVGYVRDAYNAMRITNYTKYTGIGTEHQVTDDASYQALKDNPNWWTTDIDYARYNHDSAVETLNSLPDASAYGTNTIKFMGAAGAKTDGGAINTLTAEEIAVATAKGWTVTLV